MLILRVGKHTLVNGARDEFALFQAHDIRVENVDTATAALEFARLYDYALVLMDDLLPDIPVLTGVKEFQRIPFGPNVIIAGMSTPPKKKAELLDAGACDFIQTYCDSTELIARMRVAARRRAQPRTARFQHGVIDFNLTNRKLLLDGKEVRLSRREFAIMELLALRNGDLTRRETFQAHVYGTADDAPEIKNLDVMVFRLRRKLRWAGYDHVIRTEWGVGFALYEPRMQTPITPEQERHAAD